MSYSINVCNLFTLTHYRLKSELRRKKKESDLKKANIIGERTTRYLTLTWCKKMFDNRRPIQPMLQAGKTKGNMNTTFSS